MNLSKQLSILVLLCAIGLITLSFLSLSIIKSNLYDARQNEIKSILTLAKVQVAEFVTLEKQGVLSREEAEVKVIALLSRIRAGDSYIWANGHDAISKVHPNSAQLGTFQSGYQGSLKALKYKSFVFSEGDYPKAGSRGLFYKMNGMTMIPEWKWVFGYGIYVDDLKKDFDKIAFDFLMASLVILALIIIAAFAVARLILKNILTNIGGEPRYVTSVTNRIADGHLNETIIGNFKEESLLGSVARMQHSLKSMVHNIQKSSIQLTHSTQALNEQMTNISSASQKSSESSQSTTAAIQQLSTSIEEIAVNITQTEKNSEGSSQLSLRAEQYVQDSARSINKIELEINASSQEISSLQKRSLAIGNIVNVIREIAEQTNLLALNAAIEAARAGETGRGFAVVADEVRTLASRTATATAEITETINLAQADTEQAMKTMNAVLPKVEESVASSAKVIEMLAEIRVVSDETLTQIRGVALASDEQSQTTQSLAVNAEEISSTIEATAQAIAHSTASTDKLNQLASELHDSVSYFKI